MCEMSDVTGSCVITAMCTPIYWVKTGIVPTLMLGGVCLVSQISLNYTHKCVFDRILEWLGSECVDSCRLQHLPCNIYIC